MSTPGSGGHVPARLRVALVVATAGATGVESHLLALLEGLAGQPVTPVLFVPGEGPLTERARALGIRIVAAAPSGKLDVGAFHRLASEFRGAFDVVHAHGPRAVFWALPAARRARVGAAIATVHELRWRTLPAGARAALWVGLELRSLGNADRLIAVSDYVRDALLARRPTWAPRMGVVHGSSPLLAREAPRREPARAGRLRLVTIGRLVGVKGHDRVIDALALLVRDGIDATLEIVGEGPLETTLRDRVDGLGMAARVSWRRSHDVSAELASADVFVSGTREETQGLAALEALSQGLPVVAPAVGGLREIVSAEFGILVDPQPAEAVAGRLARALAELAADPARRERMGAQAAATTRARFAPAIMAEATVAVYREALAKNAKAPRHPSGDSPRGS